MSLGWVNGLFLIRGRYSTTFSIPQEKIDSDSITSAFEWSRSRTMETNKNRNQRQPIKITKRRDVTVRKFLKYFFSFLIIYYLLILSFNYKRKQKIEFNFSNSTIVPLLLSLVGFGSASLLKILLDILISSKSKHHIESYHELLSDIRAAKDDLRSKGILID